ncbi:MAG: HesA/MoeB/ThiF family protein [Candidatus Methanoplasma sp.]|jgi:molybdopterin/thiamine biosynthesis adenylyltransferase|nr:HesA/MoeB/ThiF family protein [Candidatus Methanoplasma sp.]
MNQRYERQLIIFGEDGQKKLSDARVGVVGCGGLGTNVLTALASAGVGHLVIADGDVPAPSNLNRQFIYRMGQERKKAELMAEWLASVNPNIDVRFHPEKVTTDNAEAVLGGSDILVDCLDNIPARKEISRYAVRSGKTLVHAGVIGFHGQVTVVVPGKTPCLDCLLKAVEKRPVLPSVGAAVSFIGAAEAAEVIKLITGVGEPLIGKLFTADLTSNSFEVVDVARDVQCPICSKIVNT